MKMRQLEYFLTIADEGGFNRAAKRLHVAQPSLSVQIKALEDEIGAQLFEREVNQADFPLPGTKCGHGDEPERRHEGTLRDDFHHFPKAPKRGRKARPDH